MSTICVRTLGLVLLALFVSQASCAGEPPELVVGKGGVGDLQLGMLASDVRGHFPGAVSEANVMREGLEPALAVRFPSGASAVAELDENGRVWAIRIVDSRIPTERGIRVGDTFRSVVAAYPDARITSGAAEGGFLSLVEDSIGGYFSFDPSVFEDEPPDVSVVQDRTVRFIVVQQ